MSDVAFGLLWGAGAVVLIWLLWKFVIRKDEIKFTWRMVARGEDNRLSISKLQAHTWFIAIFFAYVATYSVRARYGDVTALGELPENLMFLLAFTTGGALGAKWLTESKIKGGSIRKEKATTPKARDLIVDDSGYTAWNKLQLFYVTVLALGIFLVGLVEELRLAAADHPPTLPNVDTTLLMLMGISQGAYIGKKAVGGEE